MAIRSILGHEVIRELSRTPRAVIYRGRSAAGERYVVHPDALSAAVAERAAGAPGA